MGTKVVVIKIKKKKKKKTLKTTFIGDGHLKTKGFLCLIPIHEMKIYYFL